MDDEHAPAEDEVLEELGILAKSHDELEKKVIKKLEDVVKQKEAAENQKQVEMQTQVIEMLQGNIKRLEEKLANPAYSSEFQQSVLKEQLDEVREKLRKQTLAAKQGEQDEREKKQDKAKTMFVKAIENAETERDRMIRTGKLTPFAGKEGAEKVRLQHSQISDNKSRDNMRLSNSARVEEKGSKKPRPQDGSRESRGRGEDRGSKVPPKLEKEVEKKKKKKERTKAVRAVSSSSGTVDDGSIEAFHSRISALRESSSSRKRKRRSSAEDSDEDWNPESSSEESDEDGELPDSDVDDFGDWSGEQEFESFEGGYKIPTRIYSRLFGYQQTGVKWLWELHCQEAGGIIGDEMGLGKTIQIIAFLAGLHFSGELGATLLLVPATIMSQWVREFHKWYPLLRVVLLHESGSNKRKPSLLLKEVVEDGGVLITTYDQMRKQAEMLLAPQWSYVVLDEGHKIRNPDAEVTQAVKSLNTPHRILLTGAPIQNRLVELWSLFDFVFPGRLGTLPVFQQEFEIPIAAGGFANASKFQIDTAYKCALELRELIDPFLLRRMKSDVDLRLPDKQEQVLFCKLTKDQRKLYMSALNSPEVKLALDGKQKVFAAMTLLRKICSHPDLLKFHFPERPADYGDPAKSTKMQLLSKILPLWKQQGHKVLLFSQTRQMLDILETFLKTLRLSYLRMDGTSGIKTRMSKIDEFNNNPAIFCFLLTTKVGGLGTNLTGANRVILYEPDWNPSTDIQARERSWRIGQNKDVVIYRLLISGTIEEKIYHRQIFKQFLTKKILEDPKQRRFFKVKDLHDLFTLGEDTENGTETGDLFADVADEMVAVSSSSEKDKISNTIKREEEEGKEEQPQSKSETDFLKKLLDGKDISSAISHDSIVNGETLGERDSISREEANRIAKNAAKRLKQSAEERMHDPVNFPTWTGRSGFAGAPAVVRERNASSGRFGNVRRKDVGRSVSGPMAVGGRQANGEQDNGEGGARGGAGMGAESAAGAAGFGSALSCGFMRGSAPCTSAELLEELKRKGLAKSGGITSLDMEDEENWSLMMMRDLSAFLRREKQCSTSKILDNFRSKVPHHRQVLFRTCLKQIAETKKVEEAGKITMWTLKQEFLS
mmetsp:Transcript_479/g.1059  ORF Transcript_479/g.1059 Transcript_479/m.1059 type:complete len:1112 (-) Transcript_479:25-3360(-)